MNCLSTWDEKGVTHILRCQLHVRLLQSLSQSRSLLGEGLVLHCYALMSFFLRKKPDMIAESPKVFLGLESLIFLL